MSDIEQTAHELMTAIGQTNADIKDISRTNGTITLTNAQARRLLALTKTNQLKEA